MSCKFLAGFFTLTIVHVKGGYISEIIFILVPFKKSTKSLCVNFLIYLERMIDTGQCTVQIRAMVLKFCSKYNMGLN